MTQVSKYRLNKRVYEKIFALFPDFLARLSKQGKQDIILDTLFSSTERIMLAKRLAISFMLVKGYTYQQIVDRLKVSWSTVGKISEIVKNADPQFISELEKIAKADAFSDFLTTIDYKLATALPPRGRNWSSWRRQIEQEKREGTQPF